MIYTSTLIICITLVLSLTFDKGQSSTDFDDWFAFKKQFNKVYTSTDEEQKRFEIFLANKRHVEIHNIKATAVSFTQGINFLSDLTTEEINRSRNGLRLDFFPIREMEEGVERLNDSSFSNLITQTTRALPTTLDWRSLGRVTPVKDQGDCGSCWAFATTGALESHLISINKSIILLSEQNLVDCSRAYGNHGCNGGLPTHALRYINRYGIESAATYPYTARDDRCKFKLNSAVLKCKQPLVLPHNNEEYLKSSLYHYGPLPVAIDASARTFHLYKSGIYDDTSACNHGVNHAMLLVGYGRQGNLDYWILKNSWSKFWGDDGYIKIIRNKNACGIASFAVLPVF